MLLIYFDLSNYFENLCAVAEAIAQAMCRNSKREIQIVYTEEARDGLFDPLATNFKSRL